MACWFDCFKEVYDATGWQVFEDGSFGIGRYYGSWGKWMCQLQHACGVLDSRAQGKTAASGSLQLAVDEYCTEAKCKQAFNTDLAEEGVLALLVKIENNSPDTHKERTGFLFYEIPKGRNDLRGLELEVNARKAGTIDTVSLVTPLPNATFKQSEEAKPVATSEDNEQGRN